MFKDKNKKFRTAPPSDVSNVNFDYILRLFLLFLLLFGTSKC